MEEIIRKFRAPDRCAVRKIACDTAFIGEPAEIFFEDREILADFLTLYFTDYEPESCFVTESSGMVTGYLIGARDTNVLTRIFLTKILPRLIIKVMKRGALLKKKNLIFIYNLFLSFLKGEFSMPDFSKTYPATLHINLEPDFRSKGAGSKLMDTYFNYLKQERIHGVHLSTLSPKAGIFFEKKGFKLLYKKKRSYFRNILNENIFCYTYGRIL